MTTDLSDDRLLAYYAQEISAYRDILESQDAQLAELQAQRDANQRCLDSLTLAAGSLERAREYDAGDTPPEWIYRLKRIDKNTPEDSVTIGEAAQKVVDDLKDGDPLPETEHVLPDDPDTPATTGET